MLPDNTVVTTAIKQATSRDQACSNSLRVSKLHELVFNTGTGDHFCVTLIGDCGRCTRCQASHLCKCLRDHFQSTTNSKRRVSTFLFWKNRLGLSFPVADSMLLRKVWSSLRSCECGIKQGNGQRKISKGPVCINPFHYHPTDFSVVMKPLFDHLIVLGFDEDKEVKMTINSLGYNGESFTKSEVTEQMMEIGFDLMCSRVRKMTDEDNYFGARQTSQSQKKEEFDYDSAYTSDSYTSSPEHMADTFAPDSPPAYLGNETPIKAERDQPPPPANYDYSQLDLPATQSLPPGSTSFELPDLAMNGALLELAAAQQLLPQMQARMWADAQFAAQQNAAVQDLDMGVELADLLQPDQQWGLGIPQWMGYVSSAVQSGQHQQNGHLQQSQFSGGIDMMDEGCYGLDQLQAIDQNAKFYTQQDSHQNMFVSSNPLTPETSDACGWVGVVDPKPLYCLKDVPIIDCFRSFCKSCNTWSFSKTQPDACSKPYCNAAKANLITAELTTTKAANIPRFALDASLEIGDVVAMVTRGPNLTAVVPLGSETIDKADTVGVIGRAKNGTGLRVNLVGLVDVKIAGPVRNLDMVFGGYLKGVATAKRSTAKESALIGQVFGDHADLATAKSDDVNLVKCLIAPSFGKVGQSVLTAMTANVNDAVGATIEALKRETNDSTADMDSALASVTNKVKRLNLANQSDRKSQCTLKKAAGFAEDSVMVLISHSSSKALQILSNGEVNCLGDPLCAESHMVVHPDGDTVKLQSAYTDAQWLSSAADSVTGSGDPDDAVCQFKVVSNNDGTVELVSGGKAIAVLEDGQLVLDNVNAGTSAPLRQKFSLYTRVKYLSQ